MLAENQLQTRLISLLLLLSAITLAVIGIQNFRYGLYNLVYIAWFIASLYLGISIYARFAPESKYLKQITLGASITAVFCFFILSFDNPDEVKHWIFPLSLLAYIALSHRIASILNLSILGLFSLSILINATMYSALAFASTYLIFMALASTYAQLHQKRNRTLVELEIHDPLTRSYNLRYLEETLKKEVCRADRTGKSLSLISLEIDYFPQLKNLHSTPSIQSLLISFTDTLKAMIRAGDSDYFDGKQTAYLLLPCTPSEGVLVIAERIRRTIEESKWPEVDSISVSLGCTTYCPKDRSSDQDGASNKMIAETHLALVEAQKNGHNRVCFYNTRH
ncbi:MAG: two-component system cell cycle response regulator [Oleiphilaceae bacterium]|jgi:diguanylate cyclase (GGDEF)-like protein